MGVGGGGAAMSEEGARVKLPLGFSRSSVSNGGCGMREVDGYAPSRRANTVATGDNIRLDGGAGGPFDRQGRAMGQKIPHIALYDVLFVP